jgi:ceramide glucosyltransferase
VSIRGFNESSPAGLSTFGGGHYNVRVLVTGIFCALTLLSVALLLWQCAAGLRFPLHRRETDRSFAPAITLLKPLKGTGAHTRDCLQSWLAQRYPGRIEILFGVADPADPVCDVVRDLLKAFPGRAELVITPESLGPNAKISNVAQLARRAEHGILCVSDADVRVPDDFLINAVAPLRSPSVGLVNCFYSLANPANVAMRWEATAVNADFWSQVLQSNSMKAQDFALGAVMIARREDIQAIGGFEALAEYLADDYQLGRQMARSGKQIVLSPVVVECWDDPMSFRDVWNHQLRWARTIRASQPAPYFFSILSNVTFWGTLFALSSISTLATLESTSAVGLGVMALLCWAAIMIFRVVAARLLYIKLARKPLSLPHAAVVLLKDFLQAAIWAASFLGNTVEWRGKKFRVASGGKLVALEAQP